MASDASGSGADFDNRTWGKVIELRGGSRRGPRGRESLQCLDEALHRYCRDARADLADSQAGRQAMPVSMTGVKPVSTTFRMSIPSGVPRKFNAGILKVSCSPAVIS